MPDYSIEGNAMHDLQATVDGYVECALWSTRDYGKLDEQGNSPNLDESYDYGDLPPDLLAEIVRDCRDFVAANEADLTLYCDRLDYGPEQVGHDLWLTRERHGAGFWDRYYGKDEKLLLALARLTEAAHAMGEFGDELNDGLIGDEDLGSL